MWLRKILFGLIVFTSLNYSNADETKKDYKKLLSKDCSKYYTTKCLKLDVVTWLEKLNENGSYSVYPGISIVRENGSAAFNTADIVQVLARDFPNDPDSRLDAFLVKKVHDFVNTHSIKLDLFKKDNVAMARKKGGGGGGGGGILALGAMMGSSIGALALAGLAAIAGKALMTALISLLLSALAGLKGGGGGKTTYEVISKPVHTYSSSHSSGHEDYHGGHGGYKRSMDDLELPLGLQPNYKTE